MKIKLLSPNIFLKIVFCLIMLFSALIPLLHTKSVFAINTEEHTGWPMFGYDVGQTRYNSHEHILGPTNLTNLIVKQRFNLGNYNDYNIGSSLVISGDLLYAGLTTLYALNQNTGKAVWIQHSDVNSSTHNLPNKSVSPVLADGVVYAGAGSFNGAAYIGAYDALSGIRKWFYSGTNIGTPLIVHENAYISSDDDFVVLDTATGIIKARSPIRGTFVGSPAYADGIVYASSLDNTVNALEETTGHFLWGASTMGAITTEPAVADEQVYVGTKDGWFYDFNAKTGRTSWSFQAKHSIEAPPAVACGMVYVGSQDFRLYALDAHTGKLRWSYKAGGGIEAAPTVANGIVYFEASDRIYYALDARTGKLLWKYVTNAGLDSEFFSPIVADGAIYLVSGTNIEFLGLPNE